MIRSLNTALLRDSLAVLVIVVVSASALAQALHFSSRAVHPHPQLASLPTELRANELLKEMTLDQKFDQLPPGGATRWLSRYIDASTDVCRLFHVSICFSPEKSWYKRGENLTTTKQPTSWLARGPCVRGHHRRFPAGGVKFNPT